MIKTEGESERSREQLTSAREAILAYSIFPSPTTYKHLVYLNIITWCRLFVVECF